MKRRMERRGMVEMQIRRMMEDEEGDDEDKERQYIQTSSDHTKS